MNLPTYLRKVAIKDYKSIATCDVELEPLTFLIGPNGSGKSNFLDALRFCADALRYSLDQAVRDRGGINEVRRRSAGRPNHFALRFEIEIRPDSRFQYYFEIGARSGGTYAVQREECKWTRTNDLKFGGNYAVADGKVIASTFPNPPVAAPDRLYLVTASGLPGTDVLYKSLSSMGFYNLNPDRIRDLQSPDPGDLLARDGSNVTAVLASMSRHEPERAARVIEYLSLVVPGISNVQSRSLGPKETLEFLEQASPDEKKSRRFLASSMSDGTLRALGVLLALFQRPNNLSTIPLVGVEEPEMALHPAAAGVLLDCLREAMLTRQVIVTSHSPDLLDRSDIAVESILAVSTENGKTYIAPVSEAGKRLLKTKMRTAGELMRINQIEPDWTKIPNSSSLQMRLFP